MLSSLSIYRNARSCYVHFRQLPLGVCRVSGHVAGKVVVGLMVALLLSLTAGCASPSARIEPSPETTEHTVAEPDADFSSGPELKPGAALEPEQKEQSEPRRSFWARLFRRTPSAGAKAASAGVETAEQADEATLSGTAETPRDEHYKLRPGDEIRLEVFRESEISGTFRLTRPEGLIRHPLLGDVTFKGLTLAEAETYVHQRLAEDFLVNPRVILRLAREPEPPRAPEEAELQVLVMGQVRNPGAVTFRRGESLTLLEAISLAGGFTKGASRNRVRVIRETDGNPKTIRVRVGDVLAGRKGHHNLELKPGDTISVPEVWF